MPLVTRLLFTLFDRKLDRKLHQKLEQKLDQHRQLDQYEQRQQRQHLQTFPHVHADLSGAGAGSYQPEKKRKQPVLRKSSGFRKNSMNPGGLLLGSLLMAPLFLTRCAPADVPAWQVMLPGEAVAVYTMPENRSLTSFLDAEYTPLLDDLTPSSVSLLAQIRSFSADSLYPEAMILYPDRANEWQLAWVFPGDDAMLQRLKTEFQQPFEQNAYEFRGSTIEKLPMSGRTLFAADFGRWLLLSESGLAVEAMIRAKEDESMRWVADYAATPGEWMIQSRQLDDWAKQWVQTLVRPGLDGALDGLEDIRLQVTRGDADASGAVGATGVAGAVGATGAAGTTGASLPVQWKASATLRLSVDEEAADLVRSATGPVDELQIDRYISDKVAAFTTFRVPPRRIAPLDAIPETPLDSLITERTDTWKQIAESLGDELALALFADSGPSGNSEVLWIRSLKSPSLFRQQMDRLVREGVILDSGRSYIADSPLLGDLIGSELQTFESFTLSLAGDVVAMAVRRGLTESVRTDASRRRVVAYDDDYMQVKRETGEAFSSFTYLKSGDFRSFIGPWLYPSGYAGRFIDSIDLLTVSVKRNDPGAQNNSGAQNESASPTTASLEITAIRRQEKEVPYEELWVYPLAGSALAGPPITADLSGSERDELLFATLNRSLYMLASDGTLILQFSTGDHVPIGSPVIYDWYGNNQPVVLQAAGDRIFAWNTSGTPLPNFPVILGEQITTPLTVMDVTRNGIAEMIVATADRSVHIIESRGDAIANWPQKTNAAVQEAPLLVSYRGEPTLMAVSENILHAWTIDGEPADGFPLFLDAPIAGNPLPLTAGGSNVELGFATETTRGQSESPATAERLIIAGRDGHLLSVGRSPLFADTTATVIRSDSLVVQQLNVTPSGLHRSPQRVDATLYEQGLYVRTPLILIQGTNGAVFLYDLTGRLRFTRSMGQPASDTFSPILTDINQDNRTEVLALADFGRLYGWDLLTGERLYELPTSGMNHPIYSDLNGDGRLEWIAETRGGLRAWTIFPYTGLFGNQRGAID